METEKETSPRQDPLFVRSPQMGQMRDPLRADWNLALGAEESADIAKLVDFSQLNGFFQNFLEVVGLPVAIIDFEARVLASSKWQRLCMEFHRVNKDTLARCLESDISLSRQMQEGKPYAIYRCRNGLTDCASPIIVEGRHVANLFIGQFLLAPPDMAYFKQQQEAFGFDEDAYFKALAEVPIVAEEKLPAILDLLTDLAQQIAAQSLAQKRVQAAYADVERQVAQRTQELQASEAMLKQSQRVAAMGHYVFDVERGRWASSETLDEVFGIGADYDRTVEGWLALVHPDQREGMAVYLRDHVLGQGQPFDREYAIIRANDGAVRWLHGVGQLKVSPVGKVMEMFGVIQDISERKRVEEALLRLNDTLEQRVREEVAKNREKDHMLIQQSRLAAMGEMIGNIAHQWRQPINALALVLANIQDAYAFGELNEKALDDEVAIGLRLIHKMSTTIDDFRDFFKPNKERAPFSLHRALEEVKGILGAGLATHGIRLEEEPSAEVFAMGYENEYAQVVLNLLNNAKEAIEGKGRGVIRIRMSAEDGMAVMRVTDDGGGIAPGVLPRIFDPYFTTKEKGSGIGLYMSKVIIEDNMEGRIEARNVEGGAEFTLYVPLAPAEPA